MFPMLEVCQNTFTQKKAQKQIIFLVNVLMQKTINFMIENKYFFKSMMVGKKIIKLIYLPDTHKKNQINSHTLQYCY